MYTSGSLGFDPSTMKLVEGGAAAQAKQVRGRRHPCAADAPQALANLEAVLKEAGSSKDKVVKTTVFLVDIASDFAVCNQAYSEQVPLALPRADRAASSARTSLHGPASRSRSCLPADCTRSNRSLCCDRLACIIVQRECSAV